MTRTQHNHDRLMEIVTPLLDWYGKNARILPWREQPIPYAVWISEIMLQQTRVEAVKPYFERWMITFPDLPSLAAASEEEVLKLWEGLGYYSRAKNIHKSSKLIMGKYNGIFPCSYDILRSLPGIGEYTAGAISSIAFQLPIPCVDGNVMRVLARLTAEKSDIAESATKRILTEWVKNIIPENRPGDFNQAMMELGAIICLPNGQPKCTECPVAFLCEAYQRNQIDFFPVKRAKAARRTENRTILVLVSDNKAALIKRPETGLLAGLWEFPNFMGELSEDNVRKILSSMKLSPISLAPLKQAKHIFTHIEWKMSGYLAFVENQNDETERPSLIQETESSKAVLNLQWIDTDILKNQLAIPSAFKTYYSAMYKALEDLNE